MKFRWSALVLTFITLALGQAPTAKYPRIGFAVARQHELKPHRRAIPAEGVRFGSNQLHLTLVVNTAGNVLTAEPGGDPNTLRLWPQIQSEISQWHFTPFLKSGQPITAEVEEYIQLVPLEHLPAVHVPAPPVSPDSHVSINLQRTQCFGSCPAYSVTISTGEGVSFEGRAFTVVTGTHHETIAPAEVRKLAERFTAADFYSMAPYYRANVTDNPTYTLSIDIDGNKHQVSDYVGQWVGMPAVIHDLEDAVDEFARTGRWIKGADGLVTSLRAERYNFRTFDAQLVLKTAMANGETASVRELLEAGVPLDPLPGPNPTDQAPRSHYEDVGWLTEAASHPDILQLLITRNASRQDQNDKDLALARAAEAGSLDAVRYLIAYGANPGADLNKLTISYVFGTRVNSQPQTGSPLLYAAQSGNPEVVREILKHHPDVEAHDRNAETALFAAAAYRYNDEPGARVEIVRMLLAAGAHVNARDTLGDTPLWNAKDADVQEELLRSGADPNARNNKGETPLFFCVRAENILLLIKYGADPNIRDNAGQTAAEMNDKYRPNLAQAIRNAAQHATSTH